MALRLSPVAGLSPSTPPLCRCATRPDLIGVGWGWFAQRERPGVQDPGLHGKENRKSFVERADLLVPPSADPHGGWCGGDGWKPLPTRLCVTRHDPRKFYCHTSLPARACCPPLQYYILWQPN